MRFPPQLLVVPRDTDFPSRSRTRRWTNHLRLHQPEPRLAMDVVHPPHVRSSSPLLPVLQADTPDVAAAGQQSSSSPCSSLSPKPTSKRSSRRRRNVCAKQVGRTSAHQSKSTSGVSRRSSWCRAISLSVRQRTSSLSWRGSLLTLAAGRDPRDGTNGSGAVHMDGTASRHSLYVFLSIQYCLRSRRLRLVRPFAFSSPSLQRTGLR